MTWNEFKDKHDLLVAVGSGLLGTILFVTVVTFILVNFVAVLSSFVGTILAIFVAFKIAYNWNLFEWSSGLGRDKREGSILFELKIWAWDRHIIRYRRGLRKRQHPTWCGDEVQTGGKVTDVLIKDRSTEEINDGKASI